MTPVDLARQHWKFVKRLPGGLYLFRWENNRYGRRQEISVPAEDFHSGKSLGLISSAMYPDVHRYHYGCTREPR